MNADRLKASLHDFIFAVGCIALVVFSLFCTGHIGAVFSWTGSDKVGMANYDYAGSIDKKGNYSKGR